MDLKAALAKLDELTADDLPGVQDGLLDAFKQADEGGDNDAMKEALEGLKAVKGRRDKLREQAAEVEKMRQEAKAAAEADKAEEPAAEQAAEAPAAEAAAEPVAAAVAAPVAAAGGAMVAPREAAPVLAAAGTGSRVYAGADIPGIPAGTEFTSGDDFKNALAKRLNTLRGLRGGDGEKVVIASISTEVDDARTLNSGDPNANWDKIESVIHPDAITAAGGCCAPLVTRYDLFDCGGVTDRPVKDALAGFRADRGGIRFYRGPALADLQGALGFWTCADDEAADPANTGTWKVCARIDCPPEETAELQAITMCLTFGVLQTRIFPEVAAANNKLALVAQARLAESALLAQIKAGSVRINDAGTPLGAVRDLLDVIGRAAIYLRDRYRIKGVPLRAVIPSWVIEVLRGDLVKGPTEGRTASDFFGISDDEIQSFFSQRGINVTWALDSAVPAVNGGGFQSPIAWTPGSVSPPVTEVPGAIPAWPTEVQWALYPEGTWLFLDGGSLDLGVIRDSTLVRVNDYMTFSETFESAVNIGCESFWITSQINVSGKAQGPIAG